MTRLLVIASAAALAMMATPALAQHHQAYQPAAPTVGANPCLLGSGAPGQCLGPVQITEQVLVTSAASSAQSSSSQSSSSQSSSSLASSSTGGSFQSGAVQSGMVTQPGYTQSSYAQSGYTQSAVTRTGTMQSGTLQMAHAPSMQHHAETGPVAVTGGLTPPPAGGCIPAQAARMVRCEGNWVYSQPQAAPAPVPVPVYLPAPAPAPAYVPAPVAVAGIAPGSLPLSFFVGGANNGVGFNVEQTYYGGGGGYVIQTGGTRFSGVRERSPTPLTPPRRQQRGHHGGGHHGGGGGCGCH